MEILSDIQPETTEIAQEQPEISSKVPVHLRKYVFRKGVSGNPGGRPVGSKSMKAYAQEYLASMEEEDRIDFLNSIDHKTIWEMAEDKAGQAMQAVITHNIAGVLDSLEHDETPSGQEALGQAVADEPVLLIEPKVENDALTTEVLPTNMEILHE